MAEGRRGEWTKGHWLGRGGQRAGGGDREPQRGQRALGNRGP
jgi:hypothetical protein